MCLIVHKPLGTSFDTDILSSAMRINKDGVGLWVRAANKKAIVQRYGPNELSVGDLESMLGTEQCTHSEVVLHIRNSTAGTKTEMNVHPIPLDVPASWGKWWIVHNGTFRKVSSDTKDVSDTGAMAEVISNLARGLRMRGHLESRRLWDMLQDLGTFDNQRLLLLSEREVFYISGKTLGDYYKGMWVSNRTAWDFYTFNHWDYASSRYIEGKRANYTSYRPTAKPNASNPRKGDSGNPTERLPGVIPSATEKRESERSVERADGEKGEATASQGDRRALMTAMRVASLPTRNSSPSYCPAGKEWWEAALKDQEDLITSRMLGR